MAEIDNSVRREQNLEKIIDERITIAMNEKRAKDNFDEFLKKEITTVIFGDSTWGILVLGVELKLDYSTESPAQYKVNCMRRRLKEVISNKLYQE